ncbi:hyalin-like [Amphiura filiformis]|uniref:hyalin-like n=1 Tax=Amphiura filiformis TaxID=82378 RepID=UPI003B21FFA2
MGSALQRPMPLYKDMEAPVISGCPKNEAMNTDPGKPFVVVSWTNPTATDNSEVPSEVYCNPASGTNFAIGLTNVTCVATDGDSNIATCSFSVFVEDVQAPEIDPCPGHQNEVLLPGENTTTVFWPVPNATDNSGITPSVKCNPPPGSLFPLGLTPIVCTAIDGSGNIASCNLHVYVQG